MFNDLVEAFLKRFKESRKVSTYVYVRKICLKHFVGHIPNVRVDLISFDDFEKWRSYFEGYTYQKKNFVLGLLKRVFDYCSDFFSYRNKWVYQLVPFHDYSIHKEFTKKVRVLSFKDFYKFYSCIKNEELKLLFLTGYFTGMRISEVRGLTGEGIKDGRIYVFQQACDKIGEGKTVLLSLKTKSSKRSIVLPGFLYRMLSSWMNDNSIGKNDFVFFSRSVAGKSLPVGENTINRAIRKGCADSGVSKFTFHVFRHTEATILFENGIDDSVITDYLGHSSFDVTKKYYLHSASDREKEVPEILESKFGSYFKN